MSQEKVAVVIPSRYASTRFPAKPLALLCGKPLVQHVYEKAAASKADLVLVATDHEAIRGAVESFGGRAIPPEPTGSRKRSGWSANRSTSSSMCRGMSR